MKSICKISVIVMLPVFSLQAAILEVPAEYATISSALQASVNGDTILVSPGTYHENINFRGKNVFLTSLYYLERDTSYISTTIIDGSNPVNPDTASCVIFNSGEDTTAVLQGFTITGGAGTKWTDIHGAGTFREGGGILVELSSPKIIHNVITGNACLDLTGVVSTGGGGIRIGDGNPVIACNSITFNQARYGAGIVLNYTGCMILNNVIASNSGGQEYLGGSGIWIYGNLSGKPKYIVNNTITNNTSALASGTGGISVWSAGSVNIKNCIIYGNTPALQIKTTSANPTVSYCDVQGGYAGTGNINLDPLFESVSYFLDELSPCVDAGDTTAIYNDLEDPENPGSALFPSRGGLRNDIGAYGGPLASLLPVFQTITGLIESGDIHSPLRTFPNPSGGQLRIGGRGEMTVFDISGKPVFSCSLQNQDEQVDLTGLPDGLYFIRMTEDEKVAGTKLILHR